MNRTIFAGGIDYIRFQKPDSRQDVPQRDPSGEKPTRQTIRRPRLTTLCGLTNV